MVRIRMQRVGRPHLAMYRINAIEKRVKRNGQVLENLGWYHPSEKDASKRVHLEIERIKHWMSTGAQPSDTVKDLLIAQNVIDGADRKKELAARAKASVEHKARLAAMPAPGKKKEEKKA